MPLFQAREPSPRELQLSGLLFLVFFGLVGWMIQRHLGIDWLAWCVWGSAGLVTLVYYAVPNSRRMIYQAWMKGVYPIGWCVSHLILAAIYFLLMTPLALLLRAFGYDPMQRKLVPGASSWRRYPAQKPAHSYFRQF